MIANCFTPAEDAYLKANYLTKSQTSMSVHLCRNKGAARQRLKILGIIVPKEISLKFGMESRMKKGNISYNKGMKQHEFLSAASIEKIKETQFKAGGLPHNTKKDFEISLRVDNRGISYKFIRVSKANWMPLHRYLYEQKNGKIASGMRLIFIDKNPMNCHLDNLELLTNIEMMVRNSYHNAYPKEVAELIQLRGALNRKINNKLKSIENEK